MIDTTGVFAYAYKGFTEGTSIIISTLIVLVFYRLGCSEISSSRNFLFPHCGPCSKAGITRVLYDYCRPRIAVILTWGWPFRKRNNSVISLLLDDLLIHMLVHDFFKAILEEHGSYIGKSFFVLHKSKQVLVQVLHIVFTPFFGDI